MVLMSKSKRNIDDFTKDAMKSYFRSKPVDVVYLFGSQVERSVGPLSDLDIAVLFDKRLSEDQQFQMHVKLLEDIGGITGFGDKVDVVQLEKVPLSLRYRVIKQNKPIYVKDENRRVKFEFQTMQQYIDQKHYNERYLQHFFKRIAKKGFV